MSITRDRGFIVVECDHCHETLETETRDFEEMRAKLNEEGWHVRRIDGIWMHFDQYSCIDTFKAEQERISKTKQQMRRV